MRNMNMVNTNSPSDDYRSSFRAPAGTAFSCDFYIATSCEFDALLFLTLFVVSFFLNTGLGPSKLLFELGFDIRPIRLGMFVIIVKFHTFDIRLHRHAYGTFYGRFCARKLPVCGCFRTTSCATRGMFCCRMLTCNFFRSMFLLNAFAAHIGRCVHTE